MAHKKGDVMDFEHDYERIGRFIYGMQRMGLDEARLKAIAADPISPEHAAQAARLLERYERIARLGVQGMSEEESRRALEDAASLARGGPAWGGDADRRKKTPPERGSSLCFRRDDYMPWMLEACLPLGPCVTSNWTF